VGTSFFGVVFIVHNTKKELFQCMQQHEEAI